MTSRFNNITNLSRSVLTRRVPKAWRSAVVAYLTHRATGEALLIQAWNNSDPADRSTLLQYIGSALHSRGGVKAQWTLMELEQPVAVSMRRVYNQGFHSAPAPTTLPLRHYK